MERILSARNTFNPMNKPVEVLERLDGAKEFEDTTPDIYVEGLLVFKAIGRFGRVRRLNESMPTMRNGSDDLSGGKLKD